MMAGMSKPTTPRDIILSALAENDLGPDALYAAVNAGGGAFGAALRPLLDAGFVGWRAGRYYARRCETGTAPRHCHVSGCETHTVAVPS